MPKIAIRFQKTTDAKRFLEILKNPNFKYFGPTANTIEDEIKWLSENPTRRKNNTEWNYTILYDGKPVGAVGIKIDSHRKYIGEIGYFLDEKYWGRGITTEAVHLAEKEGFGKLGLTRIEILMRPENKASEMVAIRCGYLREGLLKKALADRDGNKRDALIYAKVLE